MSAADVRHVVNTQTEGGPGLFSFIRSTSEAAKKALFGEGTSPEEQAARRRRATSLLPPVGPGQVWDELNAGMAQERLGAPSQWQVSTGGDDEQACSICDHTFGVLRRKHHCRNCGELVCGNCSGKRWKAGMLTMPFHTLAMKAKPGGVGNTVAPPSGWILVCDSCHGALEASNTSIKASRAYYPNRLTNLFLLGIPRRAT